MKKSYVIMFETGFNVYKPLTTVDSKLSAELFCQRANDNLLAAEMHYNSSQLNNFYCEPIRRRLTSEGVVEITKDCWDYKENLIKYPGACVSVVEVDSY